MKRQPACKQWWTVGILLASVASAAPAFAQEKSAPSAAPKAAQTVNGPGAPAAEDPEKESARLYDDGVKAAKAGLWEKARVSMLAAFKLKPSYARAANLGRVELMAAKPRDAAEHLSYFLREARGIEAEDRKAAETMLAEARSKLAVLTIQVQPSGADVLVDDTLVGHAPLTDPLLIEPGTHTVGARVADRPEVSRSVTLKAGSSETVALEVVARAAVPAPMPEPAIEEPKKSKAILFGGGLTVAALAAGIAFTVISNGKASDADTTLSSLRHASGDAQPCATMKDSDVCMGLVSARRNSDTFHDLAIAGYAVAGIAGVGTLVYVLLPSKKTAPLPRLTVTPTVGGILVNGSF
jgi:hypothetical protein